MGWNTVEVCGSEKTDRFCGIGNVRLCAFVLAVAKAEQVLRTIDENLIPALACIIYVC